MRNYDGLGGQLLFAYLHRHGRAALDRQPPDDRLGARSRVVSPPCTTRSTTLYRTGIDRTKLGHWAAAHDLIAASVPPAAGSRWAAGARELRRHHDPRPYVDLVLDDEFPLSIFYAR